MASADQIQFEFMLNNSYNSNDESTRSLESTQETGLNKNKVTESLHDQCAFTQMLNGSWSCHHYQEQRRRHKRHEEKIEHQATYKEGNEAYRNGDYQKAIYLFTKAITNISSSNLHNKTLLAKYYCNRAAAYTMISNFKRALKDYDDAILMDPTFIKAIMRKAKIYVVMKKYSEARASYLQALELSDSSIDSSLECEIKQKIDEINFQLLLQNKM